LDAGSKIPDPENLIPDLDPRVKKYRISDPDPQGVPYILIVDLAQQKWFKKLSYCMDYLHKGEKMDIG
jgi:hypothetical protein